ncbi:MAG: PD-(D/E)XK nuclease family protein [Planctomycetes bacterium]|nr:PD-(D/E)XK nuclease family protein [Planctomycetota bacterium]
MKLVHIDLERPPLAAAAEYLLASVLRPAGAGDQPPIVVVPGRRAGRRLLELLVEQSAAADQPLVPPKIITLAQLPELLYEPRRQLADEVTQHHAWIRALREMPREALAQFCPALPDSEDLLGWLSLAELLTGLHNDLAAHLLDFQDVARDGVKLGAFNESARWQLLAELQARYLQVLDNLQVWDRQTARRVAIDKSECRLDRPVILVGTVDLNLAQRRMLGQVSDRVTSLVFARPAWRERFDAHGCVVPAAWAEATIPLETNQIAIVDGPGEQADEVIRTLAALDGRRAADDITLGMIDPALVATVEQRLEECGLQGRYGPGTPLSASGPYRLLLAAAEYLDAPRFDRFAALVRQPALHNWLGGRVTGDWLSACDKYVVNHLPWRIDGSWFPDTREAATVREVHRHVEQWLAELRQPAQPWPEWGQAIAHLLLTVYGELSLDSQRPADRALADACGQIVQCLRAQSQIEPDLAPRVTGAVALQLLLRELGGKTIPSAEPDGIEMLGWLDLPWDDAAVMILTGFNEEYIPGRISGDLFLPNALRQHLQLEDDRQVYARDAYTLALIAARHPTLRIIAGRRTVKGDPLLPSRLLFATDEGTAVARARNWFGEQARTPRIVLPKGLRSGGARPRFVPPRPQPLVKPIDAMQVTQFRAYLTCPYRFYLDHCLKLRPLTDEAEELDGGQFGDLLHNVLKDFADSELVSSSSADEIYAALSRQLDRRLRFTYGAEPLPAVMVQAEQARERLRGFATWQAKRVQDGWRIRHVERPFGEREVKLMVDGQPMYLHGRVDRIDYHADDNRWALLDYKTGDSAEKPEAQHRRRDGTWVDLQLPLYRQLAGPLEMRGPIDLGYIALTKSRDTVDLWRAEWGDEDLAEAEVAAHEVVRKIRAETFWPPSSEVNALWDRYANMLRGFRADDEPAPARSA